MKKILLISFGLLIFLTQAYSLSISNVEVGTAQIGQKTSFKVTVSSDASLCYLMFKIPNTSSVFFQANMDLCSVAINQYCIDLSAATSTQDGLLWYIIAEDASGRKAYYGTSESPQKLAFETPQNLDDEKMAVTFSMNKLFLYCKALQPGIKVAICYNRDGDYIAMDSVVIEDGMDSIRLLGRANTDTTGKNKNGFNEGEGLFFKVIDKKMDYLVYPSATGLVFNASSVATVNSVLRVVDRPDISVSGQGTDIYHNQGATSKNNTLFLSKFPVTHTYLIKNTGCYTLLINAIKLNGDSHFAIDTYSNINIKAGDSFEFTVDFDGKDTSNTEINIFNNSPISKYIIPLVGINVDGADILIEETACDQYKYNDKTYLQTGMYRDTILFPDGSSQTVLLRLTIPKHTEIQLVQSVNYGSAFYIGSQILTKSGIYTEIVTRPDGCYNKFTIELTVLPDNPKKIFLKKNACENFTFGNRELTQTGIYTDSLKAVSGVDSVIVLDLKIGAADEVWRKDSAIYGKKYMFGTKYLLADGQYTETFTNMYGCDSTIHLEFKILPLLKYTCISYELNGKVLTESGIYSEIIKLANGQDSLVFIDLHIFQPDTLPMSIIKEHGEVFIFNNLTFDTSCTYLFLHKDMCKCMQFNIVILPENATYSELTAISCNSYMFGGKILSKTGFYRDTLINAAGNDSIVILSLTVNKEYSLLKNMSVAFGQTYQFGTQLLAKTGSYTETFKTLNGCDSTVTLAFTVLAQEAPHITLTVTEFSLAENSANGTALATITAEGSAGSALVYSISGSAAFAIDPTTGAVTVKDASLLDYETAQTLTFTVRVSDGTAYDEAEITIMLTDVVETGIAVNGSDISIYPNSFTDRLTVDAAGRAGTLKVFAPNGTKIYSAEFAGSADIDTSSWPSGQYSVSITSGDEAFSASIIKE